MDDFMFPNKSPQEMRQPKIRTSHNVNNESTVPTSTYINTDMAIMPKPYVLAFINTIDANTNPHGCRFQSSVDPNIRAGISNDKSVPNTTPVGWSVWRIAIGTWPVKTKLKDIVIHHKLRKTAPLRYTDVYPIRRTQGS